MPSDRIRFRSSSHATDPASLARTGTFHTPHGAVEMPAFMPVGTQGTVKGLPVELIAATGAQMILANTYHLALRPGAEVVAALGGLHQLLRLAGADPDRQRRLSGFQPGRKRAGRRARASRSARISTATCSS